MSINRVGAVLLLSAYLLPVDEVGVGPVHLSIVLETHRHRGTLVASVWRSDTSDHGYAMMVVVHIENFLLLSIQILRHAAHLLLPIHVCESHSSWHKDVVVLSTILLHATLTTLI